MPLILLCAFYAGKGLYVKLIERHQLTADICRFIRVASSEIRVRLTPLDQIIENISDSESTPVFLQVCAQRLRDGDDFHEAWLYSVRESPDIPLLGTNEQTELEKLGENLGYYDVQGELTVLSQAMEFFSEVRESCARELKLKSKMYMTCSMLTGLVIVLILL